MNNTFLPVTPDEVRALGREAPDFIYVTGDAYVDHPSFGAAIIARVLESGGFTVAVLAQPDWRDTTDFKRFGKPRLGFLVSSGNIDSMVAHYTAAKRKRSYDYYSPGGKTGKRPDRAVIVYCNRIREAYGAVPIIIGGLEASLRRFAHYDYWDDKIRRSILIDSRADLLSYGMGEKSIARIAELLDKGVPVKKIRDVRGTAYVCKKDEKINFASAGEFDYNILKESHTVYARAFGVQYKNQDSVSGKAIVEHYDDKMLVQNPPMPPLERNELDAVYALPFARTYHPMYESAGGVPAIEEVRFSITHNRGCFGGCNFCALAFHQGRSVRSRSIESVVKEAEIIAAMPDFKGYIHDIGGPTANFRHPSCKQQLKSGVCANRKCLTPVPCPNLDADHSEYVELLRAVEKIPKIKKVFIRSGIRYDYAMCDKDGTFMEKLIRDHVSGQLKVAPEHCSDDVLAVMGKPNIAVYDKFKEKYFALSKEFGRDQYLVTYLMSSHPGSHLKDAVELAVYLKETKTAPEQVQDFYPTPGTASTVMFYTKINPLTEKKIYVADDYEEKQMQRALLQFNRHENAPLVRAALRKCLRDDLIGYGEDALVRPESAKTLKANEHARKNPNLTPRWEERKNKSTVKSGKSGGKPSAKSASDGGKSNFKSANGEGKPNVKAGSGGGKVNGGGKPNVKGATKRKK